MSGEPRAVSGAGAVVIDCASGEAWRARVATGLGARELRRRRKRVILDPPCYLGDGGLLHGACE